MTWTDWPARRTPGRSLFAVFVILVCVVFTAGVDPLFALLALVLLVFATGEVLLPSRYTVDATGVTIARPLGGRAVGWAQLGEITPIDDGFELAGLGPHRWVRRRRTLRIRCPDRIDQVGAELRRFST